MDEPDRGPLRRLVAALPKAELHLHLDGSLRVETALELARTRHVDAPTTYAAMYDALVAPERTASQAELLERFDLPIALVQDAEALELVTGELVEAKAADRVRYVEIRWGPALHTRRGLSLADGIAAVCRGAAEAALRTGTVVRLICTALRSHDPELNLELAEVAARFRVSGLVGWDLAGPEERYPDPLVFERAFAAARAGGLRITLHAGEWGGAAQVRRALRMDPERIAHGPVAIDDPTLVDELIARGRRPRPLPDEQRPGRDRPLGRRPSARPPPSRRRRGHPVDGRPDGLRRHALGGVPPGGHGERADPPRAVGDRSPGARRRLRRGGRPGAAPDGVRPVGRLAGSAEARPAARRCREPLQDRRELRRVARRRRSAARPAGSAARWASVVTPVSTSTQRAPTARAAARSVPIPSPIITASRASAPTTRAASRRSSGSGLPIDDRDDAGRDLDRGDHRPGPGHEPPLCGEHRVAVRRHEPGAGPDGVGGHRQPAVRDVRVEPDDDRVGPSGGLEPVEPVGGHARRGVAGHHHLEPAVLELAPQAVARRARGCGAAAARARSARAPSRAAS